MRSNRAGYRCSFCGRDQDQVARLIAGPGGVSICNECVEMCTELIGEVKTPRPPRLQCSFCSRPLNAAAHNYSSSRETGATICHPCLKRRYRLQFENGRADLEHDSGSSRDGSWDYLSLHMGMVDVHDQSSSILSITPEDRSPEAVEPGMTLEEAMAACAECGWEPYRWRIDGPFGWDETTGATLRGGHTTYVLRRPKARQ